MNKLFDLSGKRALITGSSQGLGLALAEGLSQAGAVVVLNGRDEGKLAKAVEMLEEQGFTVHGCAFDVTKGKDIDQAISTVEKDLGPIDILINNAGIQRRGPLETFDDEDWHAVIDTNLSGVYRVSKRVARGMLERKAGKIINVGSVMSEVGRKTIVPYTASKGGVKMLTKALATEWGGRNIQVNGIGPGYFATEMNRALMNDPAFDAFVRQRTPAGRWGNPEELVGTAVYLSSKASDFVNGQMIYVDGGILASL